VSEGAGALSFIIVRFGASVLRYAFYNGKK
jgi:hypothetical protein